MNSLFSVLAISLVISLTEGCWPPPPPTPTTTPPPTTTKTTPTTTSGTTTGKYDCPIGGKEDKGTTCVGSDNVIKIEPSKDPEECNKKCEAEAKCKFWTFVPTRKLCFLLSSCDKKAQESVVSGEKGCKVPSKSFTLFNLIDKEITNCAVTWDPTDICPEQKAGAAADGKIPALGNFAFTYFDAPPSLACKSITKVTCKWDNAGTEKECLLKAEDLPIEVKDITSLYVKTTLPGGTDCEISKSPKILLG